MCANVTTPPLDTGNTTILEMQDMGNPPPEAVPEYDDAPKIAKGSRNGYLTSMAGVLRSRGAGEAELRTSLLAFNENQCDPPLSKAEVEGITRSVARYPASRPNPPAWTKELLDDDIPATDEVTKAIRDEQFTDVGNGLVFAKAFRKKLIHNKSRRRWMWWDEHEGRLRDDDGDEKAMRGILAVIRSRRIQVLTLPDGQDKNTKLSALRRSENGHAPKTQLERAAAFQGMTVNEDVLDSLPHILNAKGQWLDTSRESILSGDIEREAHPGGLITRSTSVRYDPLAKCPEWEQFIRDVTCEDEELAAYLQRALATGLTASTSDQTFFVAHGGGANGKSTLLNTIQAILGDYAKTTAFDTFDADSKNQYGNDLAALRGNRFVIAIESEQNRKLAEARVKSITGGDMISCRFLFGEYFEYRPQYKVWLAVNHKPIIQGSDRGIWRRVHLIPFNASFEDRVDRSIADRLILEGPGILNWLLEGLRDYYERGGLDAPEAVRIATQNYREESDVLGQWLAQHATFDPDAKVSVNDAFTHFDWWQTNVQLDRGGYKIKSFAQLLDGKRVQGEDDGPTVTITKHRGTKDPFKGRFYFQGFTVPEPPPPPVGKMS